MGKNRCAVQENCLTPTACPFCVDGSEYRPKTRSILHPVQVEQAVARKAAKAEHKKSAAYKMGKRNRRKGMEAEREVVHFLGDHARLVQGSGRFGGEQSNDVIYEDDNPTFEPGDLRIEVKHRAGRFRTLYRYLKQGDKKPDVLIIRGDQEEWLVVVPLKVAQWKGWL